jgi:membrane-bound lytic murein transglycosylase A
VGSNFEGEVLFTGYYQPVLEARRRPEGEFQYPLYRTPPDLQVLDLGSIDPKYAGGKIALRIAEGRIGPYFDREAIDGAGVLNGQGLELVYLRDFFDRYLLQVQGSGVVVLENGEKLQVCYGASNGFPYVSMGKVLGEEGALPPDQLSLEGIRNYFKKDPVMMRAYLNRNRRYIFFEECRGEVSGSEGVPLTPARSIATDKRVFPGGGLAFIAGWKAFPGSHTDERGRTVRGRFVLDQDTGDAMRGPGRVDVFWGTGKEAEEIAGRFKQTGRLYYLLLKE